MASERAQVQSPLGKLILLTYQEPEILGDSSLVHDVENLVNLLKFRIQNKGVVSTEETIHDELFSLRLQLLKYLTENTGLLQSMQTKIVQEVGNKLFMKGDHKALGLLMSDTLEIYLGIYGKMMEKVGDDLNNNDLLNSSQGLPSLQELKNLHNLQPNQELKKVIDWIQSSLIYDFYLIAAELVISGGLSISKAEESVLYDQLKESFVTFGFYTALMGLWHPDSEDENQLVRNIKIKIGIAQLELGYGQYYSAGALAQLIQN